MLNERTLNLFPTFAFSQHVIIIWTLTLLLLILIKVFCNFKCIIQNYDCRLMQMGLVFPSVFAYQKKNTNEKERETAGETVSQSANAQMAF